MVILALILGLLLGAGCVWTVTPQPRRAARDRADAAPPARASERATVVDGGAGRRSQALSSEALRQTSSSFLEIAKTQLSGHVAPLKESLERWTAR